MNKEEIAVNIIEADFIRNRRYFINVHGSSFSKNGTPDFIAQDKDGRILGIEVKRIGKMPEVNQWGHGLDIVKSGGRFIVAYEDFDLKQVDDYKLPVFEVHPSDDGLEQYDLFGLKPFNQTTEIIYVRGEQ